MSTEQIILPESPRIEVFSDAEATRYLRHYEPALELNIGRLVVFSLPNARTTASCHPAEIAGRAVRSARIGYDAYLHIHLHALPEGELTQRGNKETAAVAIGLFSDIDARGPGRKKPPESLCPTVKDAHSLVEEFETQFPPLRAGVIIDSGHGCYPVLLFKEPFVIDGAEDRTRLEALSRRFHAALHQIACERGWRGAVDFCDVAKVLRLPGSTNYKDPKFPKMVRIVAERPDRFDPTEIEELLPPVAEVGGLGSGRERALVTVQLDLDKPEAFTAEMIALLCDNDPDFARIWKYLRHDMDDESCSGYDMALASYGAKVGFSDGQIAWLLAENRRRFPRDRQERKGAAYTKYIQRTIARARASRNEAEPNADGGRDSIADAPSGPPEESESFDPGVSASEPNSEHSRGQESNSASSSGVTETLDDNDDEDEEDEEEDEPEKAIARPNESGPSNIHADEAARAHAREVIRATLKLDVVSVTKRGKQRGQYALNLADGSQVELGTAKTLNSQNEFRIAIIDGVGRRVPVLSRKKWERAVDALLKLVGVVETLTPDEMIADEVALFIEQHAFFPTSVRSTGDDEEGLFEVFDRAKSTGWAICETQPGGRVILMLPRFVRWLNDRAKTGLTAVEIAGLLSKIGFHRLSTIASPTWNGKRIKLNRVWVAPCLRLGIDPSEIEERRYGLDWPPRGLTRQDPVRQ